MLQPGCGGIDQMEEGLTCSRVVRHFHDEQFGNYDDIHTRNLSEQDEQICYKFNSNKK